MNTNVDNTDNLVESFQRANLDENELSTICTKSFPQEVNIQFYFEKMKS